MRIEQYIQMIDYAMWEVIENGATLPKIIVVEGVEKVMPITSAKDKAQRRLEVKARCTLMMGIPNEHQLKFNSIKDAKLLLEAVEKRFGRNAANKKTQRNLLKQQYENFTAPRSEMFDQTFDRLQKLMSQLELLDKKFSQEDVNQKLLKSLSPEWNTDAVVWRNKDELETMSINDLYDNLTVYEPEVKGISNEAVNAAYGVTTASTQVNTAYSKNIDNLTVTGNETIGFDKSKVECYNCHKREHFARKYRAPRNQDNKNKENSRRIVPIETSTSTALVSCDGLGGYDWSDQAEEGPNYVLVAYSSSSSDSDVSNESNCSKSCMETVKLLKSQNVQLLIDLEKSSLMVLGYKTCLESVEEKLEFYKKNESVYVENINGLKWDIQVGEITIRELRKKLEKIQKEKDSIQFNVDKFENATNIPPPYTGNFLPPIPDLSFTGLDEFVNKPVVENKKYDEEVSKLKFNSIKDAKILLEAVEKRFGRNAANKKTQRNLLKQQYENFTAPSSEMLDQTFDRLQKLMSQLELLDKKLSQEDVNQKLLRSLSPEWNTHAVVWRNKDELETMSIDDLYNNLKVYEPEVKGIRDGFEMANGLVDYEGKKIFKEYRKEATVLAIDTICFEKSQSGVLQLLPQEMSLLIRPVVENKKYDKEVSKVVWKSDDSLIIEDWMSDSEEENVSQTKTKKKTVKPSIAKIEFVKPKQHEKTARKIVKEVEKHRQNTHNPRGNQRNWNNLMSHKLGNNF
ncbi:hypothetical protein Tco_1439454 [Tanacetum coccineum]